MKATKIFRWIYGKRSVGYGLAVAVLAVIWMSVLAYATFIGPWVPSQSATVVSAGYGYSCGIADGKVFCWGSDTNGALGNGTLTTSQIASPVDTSGIMAGETITKVATSQSTTPHTCVVAQSGYAYCWGSGASYQLGNGSSVNSQTPVRVAMPTGVMVSDIDVGSGHTCAITTTGQLYCWGLDTHNQTGSPAASPTTSPYLVQGLLVGKTVTSIATGGAHTCAATSQGELYCWGYNNSGELGLGNRASRTAPTLVTTLSSVTQVSSKTTHTCAISSGGAYCWGSGGSGQIGDGNSSTRQTSPKLVVMSNVANNAQFTRISAGYLRTCAITSDNNAYCWGAAYTGSASTTSISSPIIADGGAIAGLNEKSVSAGYNQSCAISTTNLFFCWGTNNMYQLGDNTTTLRTTAVRVLVASNHVSTPYRFYRNANSITTGTAYNASNQDVQLMFPGQAFRLRMGVKPSATAGGLVADMAASSGSYKLQFSRLTSASCITQTTGYADVSTTSAIAWNVNGSVANNATITAGVQPIISTDPIVYQTYQSAVGPFTNPNSIPAQSIGIWDFSLRDNSGLASVSYCLRVVTGSGNVLDQYSYIPVIMTYTPSLGAQIIDPLDMPVMLPVFAMTDTYNTTDCQVASGVLGMSIERLQIWNTLSNTGWSVSLAGASTTTTWSNSSGTLKYDFNDSAGTPAGCSDGSDADSYGGQMAVNAAQSTMTPMTGCTTTGIILPSSTKFQEGITNNISIANASASSQRNCYWNIENIGISQQIPGSQDSGDYSIDLVATIVAQ